jgi:hypothetical protein
MIQCLARSQYSLAREVKRSADGIDAIGKGLNGVLVDVINPVDNIIEGIGPQEVNRIAFNHRHCIFLGNVGPTPSDDKKIDLEVSEPQNFTEIASARFGKQSSIFNLAARKFTLKISGQFTSTLNKTFTLEPFYYRESSCFYTSVGSGRPPSLMRAR